MINTSEISVATSVPTLGTSVTLAVSGTSAETAADLAAGAYILVCTVDVTFAITASGGGGSATWLTSPGIFLAAGDRPQIKLAAAKRIAAVTGAGSGPTGTLMIIPTT